MTGTLRGKRIVNTRAVQQAAELDASIVARGAVPVSYPCIALAPPADPAPLRRAVDRLLEGGFDWIAFTSVNAVEAVAAALDGRSLPDSVPVAAVGAATANAVARRLGVDPVVVAHKPSGASLAEALPVAPGQSVLIPASDIARRELPEALRDRGSEVAVVAAYRTTIGEGGADLPALLGRGDIDAVVFASPSAVDGFVTRYRREAGSFPELSGVAVGCIGATTLGAARAHGFAHAVAADDNSLSGMLDALAHAASIAHHGGSSWR